MAFPSAKPLPHTLTMLFAALVLISIVSFGECQTTTAPPPTPCSSYRSCDTCVPHAKCLWCFATNNCTEYPVTWLFPPASVCKLADARWGVCWLNFEALVITFGVLGGVVVLTIAVCCCCCCCCRRRSHSRLDSEDEQYAQRREEIRQRSEERKTDRKARHDEIRRKYGLLGDPDHPYSKFENE
ncbi:pituitary tumor-transforming gene 1 protein-interacting protein [Eucyclogobius newberryi]|uniref:pituitary tumor-transforming gene 1 protein-interacting protein n=1 Tax=Eucyclogobius newberryi TaxID=166745 RepID=UPI003B5CC579